MAAEPVAKDAAGRNVSIRNDIGSMVVRGQPDLLQQVFTNLLANAIGHSPPGAEVQVEAGRAGGSSVIRVIDHGPGVAAEDTSQIFDRFFSSPASGGPSGRSHGVGLSLSREIMRSHGGDLDFSPTPGGGATFSARFPADAIAPQHAPKRRDLAPNDAASRGVHGGDCRRDIE
jgi:signal transduction histidine kinase